MKRILLCAALLPLAACAGRAPVATEAPDIIGVVTTRSERNGLTLGVVQDSTRDAGFPRATVRVDGATRVARRSGGRLVGASAAELRPGRRVEAWFTGVVMESDPVQVTARQIVIVP